MADAGLRDLERRVASGDHSAESHLLVRRLRSGQLDRELVKLAAHLGYGPALAVTTDPVFYPCSCRIDRGPNHPDRSHGCFSCQDTGRLELSGDLIVVARTYPIDEVALIGWSADCVEHVIQTLSPKHGDRFPLLRVIERVRGWLVARDRIPAYLLSLAESARLRPVEDPLNRAAQLLVLGVTAVHALRPPHFWRRSLADAASHAYKATGYRRVERNWQIDRLVEYLLR